MTGWRIGYVCGPKEIISAMTKIFGYTMLSAPIMGQYAACAALHAIDEAKKMVAEYERRRNYIVASLNEIGLHVHLPQGAFYAFASVASTGLSGYDFAMELFKTEKVAVVPGTAFGEEYKDFVRISYASPLEDLKEAVRRMDIFMKKRKASV
jgi:aminotransferase